MTRILDKAPRELMLVEDTTGAGDPYNTATHRRPKFDAVEFVRDGRTYRGDRLPEHSELPQYIPDEFLGTAWDRRGR